ncbi:hypothetical protein PF002_g11234 [Phytophthora fragariae]|uniref:Secreted protein n=1 Tax=Phytophthora fragariae TaxID=53985 RepID=A0A6A3SD18_9STRA|nr:hypothetical protein PF003_g31492 [Phytophthora fragariae]KAE9114569.1 hypothetical protein PF007_g10329 [Phytophthora fragariae]KAE9235446.1 hypothetical protein PF004_g9119 [Phytophthora fragariae]KAE9236430.1 hypothetical protein PF002_g11234 [Phytophthora fragariae]KAE9345622.1 hypothetical protein PF008_g8657 [Phytophthora fragariae]
MFSVVSTSCSCWGAGCVSLCVASVAPCVASDSSRRTSFWVRPSCVQESPASFMDSCTVCSAPTPFRSSFSNSDIATISQRCETVDSGRYSNR